MQSGFHSSPPVGPLAPMRWRESCLRATGIRTSFRVGASCYGAMLVNLRHVTESDVRRVQSDFDRERDQFYQIRLRELRRLDLLKAAVVVARAYGSAQDLHEAEIAAALEPIVASKGTSRASDSVAETIRRLESVGFIWQPGCARPDCYSRGIPSLMDYVLKAASSATSARSG